MEFELGCVSSGGAQCVELADKHAADFAVTADRFDRDNAFPTDNWAALQRSGFLAATVPVDLGGLGLRSIHDLVVAISRLARGDGSTAIGAAMHLTAFWYLARLRTSPSWPVAAPPARHLDLMLRACARRRAIACVAISERGTPLGNPATTAEPAGSGYRISGRKAFCTNSPAATLFLSTVRLGADEVGFAVVPRTTPGLRVLENWDALGVRASGSGDVVFDGCQVAQEMVVPAGPVGALPPAILPLTMVGALVLASAFLGMSEQAQDLLTQALSRPRSVRPAARALVGENEIDIATSRAVLARTAVLLDERLGAGTPDLPAVELAGLMREVQCANMAAKRAAITTVDRCLTASGGGGYLSSNPMSRLYRDVRAGPFMQPFSALDAFEYIGSVRLGLDRDPGRPNGERELP
ncbi:acyl-CoA dehydrogenase [Solihabitans fulvus]|uniref:Acyl-CoA dehydrogenase n=1 Tax=Solihabitans fulvus TaxID=1892852 RepID=A0A5B2XRS3_9PSEU|nr:acyl-CoA dehydrogenase family protein [Solihabitans fulvus]KAA2265805.1 acyl-CoA dehydrogenase [Solihabitans fulvus]